MPLDMRAKNNPQKNADFEYEEYEEMTVEYGQEPQYDGALHRWTASEHSPYTVGKRFYFFSTLFLALIIGYAIYSNNPIMAITFILIGIVGYVFLHKPPLEVHFSIMPSGIRIGNELYEFDNLKSFWIFYNPPYEKKISLESKSRIAPRIHIPLGDEDPVKIRELLVRHIPEVKQEHTLIDVAEHFLQR